MGSLASPAESKATMQLTGIHHLTAVTAKARGNLDFYTDTLGMRLVKKTVNQDDVSSYHLFYADGRGSPGTDLTFFDWPAARERRGTSSIVRTGLRVPEGSLGYWADRLRGREVPHRGVAERDGRPAHAWEKSPVPAEHQVRGLGPITISVPDVKSTDQTLTRLMNMRRVREF